MQATEDSSEMEQTIRTIDQRIEEMENLIKSTEENARERRRTMEENVQRLEDTHNTEIVKKREELTNLIIRLEALESSVQMALKSSIPKVEDFLGQLQKTSHPITSTSGAEVKTRRNLMKAIYMGRNDIVKQILQVRTDIPIIALHIAVEKRSVKLVSLLLDNGANLHAIDEFGRTVLHYAAKEPDADVVNLLLNKGADCNAKDTWGRTALHVAAHGGNFRVVAVLLDYGALLHTRNENGWTPLHEVVCIGKCDDKINQHISNIDETVKLLVESGADINAQDYDGRTVLHLSTMTLLPHYTPLLLKKGANVHVKDRLGRTALHYCRSYFDIFHPIAELIDAGAGVNEKDDRGMTPLHAAAARNIGKYDIQILLEAGASKTVEDDQGRIPRDLATNPSICQLLE